ncbi:selenium cofactor biosynthesis protein YqeC [Reinekea marinisedimentorum]|uniref:Putative selenium-dependent hydroxylase accessory protein YqeC n=1 Tax=Reinekea marinisedimentorum TaxID=230495 RepID=A0A4R3IAA2_9GAMM|nr:selenium cofactor biosynthesis protein YqeC [Reinekea marinisedimentorum]TCS41280.1 putative selenium-dependent hydroxylase accessory protein YqeC [Reinekea marinisedimentorum]
MISPDVLYPTLCALKPAKSKTAVISAVGAGGKTHTLYFLANLLKGHGHSVCVTTTTKMYMPKPGQVDNQIQFSELDNHSNTSVGITFIYASVVQDSGQQSKATGMTEQHVNELALLALFDFILVEADGAKGLPLKAPARHEPCIPKCTHLVIGVTSAELFLAPADATRIHRWPLFSELTGCEEGSIINEQVIGQLLTSNEGLFKNTPEGSQKVWLINKLDQVKEPALIAALAENLLKKVPGLDEVWLTQLNGRQPINQILTR